MKNIKPIFLFCLLLALTRSQDFQHPTSQSDEIVMAVGQIMPGKIDIAQSKQQIHLLRIEQIERKYLFVRASTFTPVRMSIGIYSN